MIKKLKRIFAKETTYNDKVLILHIALIYAICSSCFIGISVWFKQPILLCRDHKTLKQTICNEDFACDNPKISFHIDHKKGHHSLAAELNLICHRKFYQRLLLSMIFLGGFLGCLINALIFVPPTKRKMALSFLCLIVVNAKLGVLMMHENIYFVGFFLSVISSACIIINSYCFALMNEVFSGEVSKIGTVIMTLFWGVFGIIFAFFCYYIDSNWKIIFWTVSLLLFFIAISLLVLENEKGVREASTKGVNI